MSGTLTTSVTARHLRRGGNQGARRTDIQGLRAFAVLVVVLSHARIPGMTGGYIGVDVFFVISGFLITSLLLREIDRTGWISIRGFYERRALRILPAGTVVLVATVLYAAILLPMGRLDTVAMDAIWSAFFLANVRFSLEGTDYFAGTTVSPLQHFWSLAVEEQFYLVWPLVLLGIVALIARRRRRPPVTRLACLAVAVIIAGSMIASGIETALSPTTAYFSTVDRAYELAGGALLAILTAAGTRLPRWYGAPLQAVAGWLGLAALLVMVVAWNEATPIPGLLGGLVVLATAAVLASGIGGLSGPGRLLSLRPMQFFGDISYSLYLWHWPLLTLGLMPGVEPRVRVPVLIVASIAFAALSFRYIEQPFLRGAVRLPRRTGALLLWPVAASLVVVSCVAALGYVGQAAAQEQSAASQWYQEHPAGTSQSEPAARDKPVVAPVDQIRQRITQALSDADAGAPVPPAIDWKAHKRDIFQEVYPCVAWWEASTLKLCPVGDKTSSRTVVIVGDSHAGQWISALDELGKKNRFKLVPIIKPACNVYDVEQRFAPAEITACNEFKTWARRTIAGLKAEAVVVSARGFDGMRVSGPDRDPVWRAGAESGIRALKAIAPKVMVLSDVPSRSSKVDDCLTLRGATLEQCVAEETGVEIDSNALTKAATLAAGAQWVDTSPLVCQDGRCPAVVDQRVVYYDDNHLTVSWGRVVAAGLGQLLGIAPAGQRG